MVSLFIRNFIFTVLQPGIVAGLIPYWILGENGNVLFVEQLRSHWIHLSGAIICLVGLIIMLTCIVSFAVYGQGTLSPVDPTKKLVVSGLYTFSRNPMYVGVILILIGESIFFTSVALGVYSIFIFIVFYIFIVFFEEPRLRKDFGEEYKLYCEKVRRWI